MNFNPRPAQSVSPGQILSAELEARGWSQKDLAEITDRPHQAINEIIKGTKQITPETAIEFAEAFGTSSDFWLNLESNYRLHEAERQKRDSRKIGQRSRLFEKVPLRELIKRGWIKSAKRIEELEEEVCRFLQIDSIDQTPKFAAVNFRRAEERGPEASAQLAWIARVEQLARLQNVGRFVPGKLTAGLKDILSLSEKEIDVGVVPEKLASLGIHFVIVRHMPKTYLDGATWMIGRNPVVALTLRYDRIDSFWFTLLHEIDHIIRKHTGVCTLYDGKSANKEEKQANEEAKAWLVDPNVLQSFVKNTRFYYSKDAIQSFAIQTKRHPGIIVGRLQYDGLMGYNYLRNYLVKVRTFLKDWMDPTFYYNVRKEID